MRDYHKSLKEKGITQSMSRKGNCLDNSITENFFGLMKKRDVLGHQHDFMTLNDLEQAMKEYIEYYNTQRIKVKLKGLTPVRYRKESLRFQTS
jgi:transposase InsO family protein